MIGSCSRPVGILPYRFRDRYGFGFGFRPLSRLSSVSHLNWVSKPIMLVYSYSKADPLSFVAQPCNRAKFASHFSCVKMYLFHSFTPVQLYWIAQKPTIACYCEVMFAPLQALLSCMGPLLKKRTAPNINMFFERLSLLHLWKDHPKLHKLNPLSQNLTKILSSFLREWNLAWACVFSFSNISPNPSIDTQ